MRYAEGDPPMATFVSRISFTDQGLAKVKDTCKRAAAFKSAARSLGVKVREIYWTLGPFDGLIIMDAPDDDTATAALLYLGSLGNVHTQSGRAYKSAEMERILDKLPD
jgi:uncharacterized protein with GYD domain